MGGLTNQKKTKELIANTIRDLSSTWATYHTSGKYQHQLAGKSLKTIILLGHFREDSLS